MNSGRAFGMFVIVVVSGSQRCSSSSEDPTPRAPVLQRVEVFGDRSFTFDFGGTRGPTVPVLIDTIASHGSDATRESVHRYYLFGVMGKVHSQDEPFRWSMTEDAFFCTFSLPYAHQRTGPTILRFPRRFLVAGPDDGRSAIDRERLGGRFEAPDGSPAPNYAGLQPVRAALLGIEGWTVGDVPLRNGLRISDSGHPDVNYDVRALDASHVELYMTVNGKLSRWVFDGKDWALKENYAIEIEGPFLVRNDGTSLVAARDGRWCLLKGIDTENPTVTPIVAVSENKPLLLIEDRSVGKAFFELAGDIFDESGKRIARIPASVEPRERVTAIVRTIRSRRD